MFKAPLIENERYYKLKGKQLLLFFVPIIPLSLMVIFYQIPVWLTITSTIIYALLIILYKRNRDQLKAVIGAREIEIDEETVRIKSNNGSQEEAINLSETQKIILKKNYSLPSERVADIRKEIAGNGNHNYLILQKEDQERTFYFEINSHYMLKQLTKIIQTWESRAYNIVKVD